MKKHIQTQTEWENEMAKRIIEYMKSELYLHIPFMNVAFQAFLLEPSSSISTMATDGRRAYYSSEQCIRLFQKNSLFLNRLYLHMTLHCLFFHLWQRGVKNKDLWNLACDICVEYTIDHLNKACTHRILTLLRKKTYEQIESLKGVSASNIYIWLLEKEEKERMALKNEFYCDDHRFWPMEQQQNLPQNQMIQKNWQKISKQTSLQIKRGKEEASENGLLMQQIQSQKKRRSYKEFLKAFSVQREEIQINEDEFDLSYYTYGLTLYKNLPLVEPLETKEIKKIREFVIVVDTSYSTNGELVENFLKETYTLLSENDSFFHKSRVHILQCDDQVRAHHCVESKEQMEKLMHAFTLLGGQGTDFRKAFEYVNEWMKQAKIQEISGLIYFTDGKGIYPKKRPDYKTAFLFLDDFDETKLPPWAMRLKLDPCELQGE